MMVGVYFAALAASFNKRIKNRPQKTWAGLANARLLCERYTFINLGVHILLIGEVAELTGATRKAIRHYEAIELIPSPKRSGTYRLYSEHDVMVISMIRRAQTLGFSLKELKDIVSKKITDQKLPIPLVSAHIDNKVIELERELESLQFKIKKLKEFKIDLIKEFS